MRKFGKENNVDLMLYLARAYYLDKKVRRPTVHLQ